MQEPLVFTVQVNLPIAERGYCPYPASWTYDPISQTTDLYRMGESSPTTYSRVGSTGMLSTDTDEGSDDEGKD
jgi:hypothetical protein